MGALIRLPFDSARRRAVVESRVDPEHFSGPLVVLWLGSAARVALALAHHEVFETEATLALLCLILIPFGALRSWREARAVRRAVPPGLRRVV